MKLILFILLFLILEMDNNLSYKLFELGMFPLII